VTTKLQRVMTRTESRSPTLSQDVAFEMLSCRRRRYVVHYLKRREETTALRELVTRLAAWENRVAVTDVTHEQRMRVYTALRQSHLPKLDESGIVAFDADRGTVELTEAGETLEVYLDVVPHNDISWSKYYVGLGILCTGFATGMWLGVLPFSLVPPTVGTLLVTVLFTVSAVFHVRYDRRMRLGDGAEPPRDPTRVSR